MLNILKSGFTSLGRDRITERIKLLTSQGKRSYLIVPEQETVITEAEMTSALPEMAPLYFEVTNFTRLANSTFRTLGGISGEYCDAGKQALFMWRALTELSPLLDMTSGRREIGVGLVERALAAVKEMQSLGITPSELAETADEESVKSDRRLSGKLSDLSKIYALYKSLLSEKYSDTADDTAMMIKKLGENPTFLSDTEIFISGFTSFTEPQYKLLSLLSSRCSLTVHLTVSKRRYEAFEYAEVRSTEERLKRCARLAAADIKVIHEDGRAQNKSVSLSEIADLLWFKSADIDNITLQNKNELRIVESMTPFEECDYIANDIKRRVMDGACYSDFAIVARSADKYMGILDTSFNRAGVPLFTSYRRDIGSFEVIKLIYTAYSIARGSFSREDVLTYAKCGMAGISREECDEFEMYVNKWQISGSRFTEEGIWSMNPLGYTPRRPEGTDEKLLRIHSTRIKLIEPLKKFTERIGRSATVKYHAEALLDFLLQLDIEERLEERARTLELLGESEFAEENRRLWGLICDSLDSLVLVLGDSETDAEGFFCQLKIILSAADIGRIPSYRDTVTAGSADMLRLSDKKHVYLIGVNAGEFPASVSENSYFTEHDKEILTNLGLAISPELETKSARELYIFSRAFNYASESVTICYTTCDTRFKAAEPAEVISRIIKLTGGEVTPIKVADLSIMDRIYTASGALLDTPDGEKNKTSAIKEALIRAGYGDQVRIREEKIQNDRLALSRALCDKAYSSTLALTQTRIDSFVNCPLNYFCKFTVKLSEEKLAEFDAPGIGSFIHAILENFFRTLSTEGKSASDLTDEEKYELTRRAAKKYIDELGEAVGEDALRTSIKLQRLCRAAMPVVEGLCEEFAGSGFEPKFFELEIKRDNSNGPAPIRFKTEGGDISIYGIIDRVDVYKHGDDVYLRVVDYKTGQKHFSPEDMAEGSNLQMFLYLKSLVETENQKFREAAGTGKGGRLIPAGVIYVKTSVKDAKIDTPDDEAARSAVKAAQKREGMILDDDAAISAMNLRYTPLYSARTPDKISESKRKFLYSEDGWENIMQTVESSVKRVAGNIRSGDAGAKPKVDSRGVTHCQNCEFKPFCRNIKLK